MSRTIIAIAVVVQAAIVITFMTAKVAYERGYDDAVERVNVENTLDCTTALEEAKEDCLSQVSSCYQLYDPYLRELRTRKNMRLRYLRQQQQKASKSQ